MAVRVSGELRRRIRSGDRGCIVVIVESHLGWVTMDYYKAEHLPNFGKIGAGSPELAEKFFAYYGAVFEDGALSKREKALIALAVAHTVQCPYCIDAYTKESLQQGSDLEQMTEAVHVATAIRGGASLIHGLQMLDQVDRVSM